MRSPLYLQVGLVALAASSVFIACGGGTQSSPPPDEIANDPAAVSLQLEERSTFSAEGTTPAGPELDGTQWTWVEAHCTDGPLELRERDFSETVRVDAVDDGLLLTRDQNIDGDCVRTVVQRALKREERKWTIMEETRVYAPATEECEGRPDPDRPGEVRMNGEFLELLVQRSIAWCNGFEVRMVYAPRETKHLDAAELGRHYVLELNRRDPKAIAELFSAAGSVLDAYQRTPASTALRFEGREAIAAWYEAFFAGTEWSTMQLESVEAKKGGQQVVVHWKYMDPRVEEPLEGESRLTVGGGEIFEAVNLIDGRQSVLDSDAGESKAPKSNSK